MSGEKLREIRRRRGLSQEDLAARSGVSARTISRIETERFEPRAATLRKLASALGVEPSELM